MDDETIRQAAEADKEDKKIRAAQKELDKKKEIEQKELDKHKAKTAKEIIALKNDKIKLQDKQKRALADQKFRLKKEKDSAARIKVLTKENADLKKKNAEITKEKHDLDKELQSKIFEQSKSMKYENQLNFDTKEIKVKHKKEIEQIKEIHEAKYRGMEKVEERLLEDLKMYEKREEQRFQ